ncbi:hypothetical protein ACQJBY_035595 [Aegilops geniculata]
MLTVGSDAMWWCGALGVDVQSGGFSPMRCRMKALMSSTRMMQGCWWKAVRMGIAHYKEQTDDVPLRQIPENNARNFCSHNEP